MDNSSKDDYLFDELLKQFELPVPYDGHMQYARVFQYHSTDDKAYPVTKRAGANR